MHDGAREVLLDQFLFGRTLARRCLQGEASVRVAAGIFIGAPTVHGNGKFNLLV